MDGWIDVVKLFQIATPTVFVRFLRKLAHVMYVPIRKTGTDFRNFALKIFDAFFYNFMAAAELSRLIGLV